MSAAHTPGPWVLDTPNDAERANGLTAPHFWQVQGDDGQWIAYFPLLVEEAWPRLAANARLIAAAPSMYEYIASSASNGCAEAQKILESIHAGR